MTGTAAGAAVPPIPASSWPAVDPRDQQGARDVLSLADRSPTARRVIDELVRDEVAVEVLDRKELRNRHPGAAAAYDPPRRTLVISRESLAEEHSRERALRTIVHEGVHYLDHRDGGFQLGRLRSIGSAMLVGPFAGALRRDNPVTAGIDRIQRAQHTTEVNAYRTDAIVARELGQTSVNGYATTADGSLRSEDDTFRRIQDSRLYGLHGVPRFMVGTALGSLFTAGPVLAADKLLRMRGTNVPAWVPALAMFGSAAALAGIDALAHRAPRQAEWDEAVGTPPSGEDARLLDAARERLAQSVTGRELLARAEQLGVRVAVVPHEVMRERAPLADALYFPGRALVAVDRRVLERDLDEGAMSLGHELRHAVDDDAHGGAPGGMLALAKQGALAGARALVSLDNPVSGALDGLWSTKQDGEVGAWRTEAQIARELGVRVPNRFALDGDGNLRSEDEIRDAVRAEDGYQLQGGARLAFAGALGGVGALFAGVAADMAMSRLGRSPSMLLMYGVPLGVATALAAHDALRHPVNRD